DHRGPFAPGGQCPRQQLADHAATEDDEVMVFDLSHGGAPLVVKGGALGCFELPHRSLYIEAEPDADRNRGAATPHGSVQVLLLSFLVARLEGMRSRNSAVLTQLLNTSAGLNSLPSTSL